MLDERFYVSHGPLILSDIVEGLEVKLPDPKFFDETISHVSSLSGARPLSLVFLGSKKSLKDLDGCKATACFVTEELSEYVGANHIIPIISKYPRAHFARAMAFLGTQKTLENTIGAVQIDTSAQVHESAITGAGVVIGARTIVGPNCVFGPGVEIGSDCIIGPNVTIDAALIGKNCVIKAGAVIGGRGFGVVNDEKSSVDIPHFGRVILGNDLQIGANSCVDRGQIGDTVLADNVKLDNLVQIAHNVEIGEGSRLAAHTGISGSCIIGRNVMMGGSVGLADHVKISDNVHIAARAGVMHDIPAGQYWGGTPAQPMKDFMRQTATMRKLSRRPKRNIDET